MKKFFLTLFFVSFLCLISFVLGLFASKIFFILSLIFGLLFIFVQFSFLEEKILKNINNSFVTSKNLDNDDEFDNTKADEHPIIISARKRLKK